MWAFIHNAVAHPLLAFSGNSQWANRFHDYTAQKAFVGEYDQRAES